MTAAPRTAELSTARLRIVVGSDDAGFDSEEPLTRDLTPARATAGASA